jgi:hypothetical protein
MAEALSPEEQIVALRRELAQRDAIIAAREAELAEAAKRAGSLCCIEGSQYQRFARAQRSATQHLVSPRRDGAGGP